MQESRLRPLFVRQHESEQPVVKDRLTGDVVKRVGDAIHETWHTDGTTVADVAKAAIAAMGDASNRKTEAAQTASVTASPTNHGSEIPVVDEEVRNTLFGAVLAHKIRDGWTGNAVSLSYEIERAVRPYLCTPEPVMVEPVSLMDCAMALQGNPRIKLGSNLQAIAKAVLDKAGVEYHED